MSWWAAILWTLGIIVVLIGAPLATLPISTWWQARQAAQWSQGGKPRVDVDPAP